jgi:hypothetical protein
MRLIVKHVGPNLKSNAGHFWDRLSFLASWLRPHQATVVCLDTRRDFQDALLDVLRRPETNYGPGHPLRDNMPNAGPPRANSQDPSPGPYVASRRLDPRDPYALQSIIIEQVLALYDKSIWGVRDLVRGVERVTPPFLLSHYPLNS